MVGDEIKRTRKLRGITQRDLAKMINVKPNTMSQYENGKSEVSFHVLREISRALGCSSLDLAYEELGIEKPCVGSCEAKNGAGSDEELAMEQMISEMFKSIDIKCKYKVLEYVREQVIVSNHYKKLRHS
ncbi:helix-turn-helix transcriptional regulator [Cloacibacillus sp. An23]|uniref:helix-turn-helix domain-containing protein n=1 Tax=Cloacibacillus sp. An23 TaxID=1965591 RepID=UPI000B387F69|nr:helix-turn-helix transcriptional regulator [Cloacibacillus sp. An23]OUO92837.1 hypothetical protein B5F39_10220 [Cloacibacillus sp. An23]